MTGLVLKFARAKEMNAGISAKDISERELFDFLESWSDLSKAQKKTALETIETGEGYNLLHLIAKISSPLDPVREKIHDVLVFASLEFNDQDFLNLLAQKDIFTFQKPVDLATDESFKQHLFLHEAKSRTIVKEQILNDITTATIFGFGTLLAVSLDFNTPASLSLGAFTGYSCYKTFKKTLILIEK